MNKHQDANTLNQVGEQLCSTPVDALTRMDDLIKRGDAINERIAVIKREYGAIDAKRHPLRTTIFKLQDRLRGMPDDDKRYTEARQELIAELDQARLDTAQNEEHHKKLDEELKQLQTIELPACMVSVCADDVMEHHQLVKQATHSVAEIQAVIDSQGKLIAASRAAIPKQIDRQQERHNLMADIALRNASEEDLKKLDADIAKDNKAIATAEKEASPLIENGKATISGLERKLAAAQETLNIIESRSSEVAHRYFIGEAEIAAVQYVNYALHMKELYLRLLGLDLIINKHDGIGIKFNGAKSIQIPLFRLPQFGGIGKPSAGEYALLDGDKIYLDHAQKAADTEKSRLDAILDGASD